MCQIPKLPSIKAYHSIGQRVVDVASSVLITVLVWTLILSLPLFFTLTNPATHNFIYQDFFPSVPMQLIPNEWPSPVGLTLGITAVAVGQFFTLCYFSLRLSFFAPSLTSIQKEGAPKYHLATELLHHLSQPEGFILLGAYLTATWMYKFMPESYYSFEGGIIWSHVLLQLLLQDFIQYCMHILEHKASAKFYKISHKFHHKFTNPKLFDAFNGSFADTFCMILIPLFITSRLVHTNVWSYMAFGSLYANWLCLIHAEYIHPWDHLFQSIGFGTAASHHVHHKLFVYNFGHLFM